MHPRILLFDDDSQQMTPLKDLLEQQGYQVELTAQKTITQRLMHEKFDLICVDLMIHPQSPGPSDSITTNVRYPNISWQNTGMEFVKQLRHGSYAGPDDMGTPKDVPIIILSATADPHNGNGADEILEKPFDPETLLQIIKRLLSKDKDHG